MFAPDELVVVVTTDLVSRSAPGTGDDSEILPGDYDAPRAVFVVDGPAFANGYEWYLVEPVRVRDGLCDCPFTGWVAAAGKDGEAWLGPDTYTCAMPPLVELIDLEPQRALACYGSTPLTMEGTFGGCADSGASAVPWETFCLVYHSGVDVHATPDPGCVDVCRPPTLPIFFSGDIGAPYGHEGASVRVEGHFDDPAAQGCLSTSPKPPAPRLAIHYCRMTFVATSVERIDG